MEPRKPLIPIHESRERYLLYAPPRAAVARARGEQPSVDPRQPWTTDHPWKPQGMNPDYAEDPGGSVRIRGAILAAIALLNLALLASKGTFVVLLVLALDLAGLLILFDSILKIWQWFRHPRVRMRWTSFPAFLGGRLEGTLVVRPGQHVLSTIKVRLRCVRDERVEHRNQDGTTISALEPYIHYEQSFEILPPGETLDELALGFDLPPDAPSTDLGSGEPTYWQVALRIPVTGPDIEVVFLAPVYAPRD
jgi:hypothetical protein